MTIQYQVTKKSSWEILKLISTENRPFYHPAYPIGNILMEYHQKKFSYEFLLLLSLPPPILPPLHWWFVLETDGHRRTDIKALA